MRKKLSKDNKEEIKEEIETLGLNTLKNYFGIDIGSIELHLLTHIHQRARIAMQFERERNITKRAIENNYIRVFKLVAEDKKELKQLIRQSIPQYYPG